MLNIMRSEFLKFRSSPLCVGGIMAAILMAPVLHFISVLTQSNLRVSADTAFAQNLSYFMLGQAGVSLMAAGLCGQEYEKSSLRTALLTVPRRLQLLVAKINVISILIVIAGSFSILLSICANRILLGSRMEYTSIHHFVFRALLSLTSWVMIGWICSFISIIFKSAIVPLAIMFPLLFGLSQMLFAVFAVSKFLPDLAAMNLFFIPGSSIFLSVPHGLFVQFIWTAMLGIISTVSWNCRDVR